MRNEKHPVSVMSVVTYYFMVLNRTIVYLVMIHSQVLYRCLTVSQNLRIEWLWLNIQVPLKDKNLKFHENITTNFPTM